MALSFSAVEKAYEVFNEIKKTTLPDLIIGSNPPDIVTWDREDIHRTQEKRVYGSDRKYDGGWESIFFWVKHPTRELKEQFENLRDKVPNSSYSSYNEKVEMWEFGWF